MMMNNTQVVLYLVHQLRILHPYFPFIPISVDVFRTEIGQSVYTTLPCITLFRYSVSSHQDPANHLTFSINDTDSEHKN